jgi:hypothetical protein
MEPSRSDCGTESILSSGLARMPLRISCPEGHTLVVSQARAGSTLRCPKCSAPIVVPPPVPPRKASLVDVAMSALAAEAEKPLAASAVIGEPEPPPIVAPPAEAAPPPVWTPPPKSRAIVEPPPEEMVQEARPATDLVVVKEPDPEPVPKPVSSEVPAISVPPPERGQESTPADDPVADNVSRLEPTPDPVAVAPPQPVIADAEADLSPTCDECDVHPPLVSSTSQQLGANVLSFALAAAALFGAAPAIWDFVQYAQAAENAFVPRWALALVAFGIVQVAYAVYLAQLPDWMSGWIVTIICLAMAALYAGMLGITLLASEQSFLIRGLDLAEVAPTGRAAMWCLCMTSILATLAFFAGRTSLRWHAAEARA